MANLLTDWLGPEIDKNLKEGVEWLSICKEEAEREVLIKEEGCGDGEGESSITERAVNARRFLGPEYQRLYENDGSNVRVNVDRGIGERSCVQLVEFEETEPNIRVLLSDGFTSVPARFSSISIEAFQEQYRKRITQRTRGGIIAITEFEIVATPYGPRRWQVSLLIKKLDWQGSGGSPSFGNPQPVRERGVVDTLLDKVEPLLNKLSTPRHSRSQTPHHSRQDTELPENIPMKYSSQAAEGMESDSGSESMLCTQTPLATQVSRPARADSVEIIGGSNVSRPTQPGHFHRAAKCNVSRPSNLGDPRTVEVLNLLTKKPVEKETLGIGRQLHLQPAPQPASNMNKIANQPDRPKLVPAPLQTKNRRIPESDLKTFAETDHQDRDNQGKLKPKLADVQWDSHISNAMTDITDSSPRRARSKDPICKVPDVEIKPLECSWMNNPITRHMCNISSEQQAILCRPEAWLPSQPGMSFPGANIPIKVLNCLNSLAERQASHEYSGITNDSEQNGETPESQKSSSESTRLDKNQDSGSDSDIPTRFKPMPKSDVNMQAQDTSEPETSPSSAVSWSRSPSLGPPHRDDMILPPDSSFNNEGAFAVTTPKGVEALYTSPSLGSQVKSVSRTLSTTPRGNTAGKMKSRPHGDGLSPGDSINLDYLVQEGTGKSENFDMPDLPTNTPPHSSPISLHPSPPTASKGVVMVEVGSSGEDDDDIEMSVPRALDQVRGIRSASASPLQSRNKSLQPQSSITQRIPKLQVKETPYSLGRTKSRMGHERLYSPRSPGRPNLTSCSKDTTSSTSVIPSSYKDIQKPSPTREYNSSAKVSRKEANPLPEGEEAVVDQQIQEEVKAAPQRQPSPLFKISVDRSVAAQNALTVLPESSPTNSLERSNSPKLIPHIVNQTKARLSKRGAENPSAEKPRQPKKLKTDYGFSQEEHSSQDVATRARESRREFFMNLDRSEGQSEISPSTKMRETIPADENTKSHHTIDKTPELYLHRSAQDGEAESRSPQSRHQSSSNQKRPIQRVSGLHSSPGEHEVVEGWRATMAKASPKIPYTARDHWSPGQERISREDRISKLKDTQPPSRSTFPSLQPNTQISATLKQSSKSLGINALYSKFTEAYPDYTGDEKHFVGLCRMIDNLQKAEKMEHKSLWDDFIIRHKTSYGKYIVRCSEEGDDPVPYIKFYHDQIDEPAYTKRIMEPGILKSALDQYSASPAVLHPTPSSSIPARRQPNFPATARSPKRSRRSLPWARPPPSSSIPSSNRTRRSLPSGDHLRSKPPSQSLNRPCAVEDSPPGANAMEEKNEIKWHEQNNTPFKGFVSGYVRLKSVEGRLGAFGTNGTLRPPANVIDVLLWPFNRARCAS